MDVKTMPGVLMSLLSIGSLIVILRGLQLSLRKTGWELSKQKNIFYRTFFIIILWVGTISLLAWNGFFSDFSKMPPRPAFAVLLPLPFVIAAALSAKGSQLIKAVPPHWLIGMQSFRILVEILLWRAFLLNLLPIQMTFEGNNFDGLSGVLAIPFALILRKKWSSFFSLLYNIIGIALLLNILVIAVLSMPAPLRYFMNEPPNTLVGEFPFIFLPAVLVVIAYSMHIFSLRQWWLFRKNN
jgi:hypothetical protein